MSTNDIEPNKCGGIITTPDLESVIVVMNRHSAWKGENKWGLPKGHARQGETPPECAQREILEETGLYFPTNRFKRFIHLNGNYYYLIVLKEPYQKFKTNDEKEISEVRWMPIEELRNYNYNSDIKRFLKVFPFNRVEFGRCYRKPSPNIYKPRLKLNLKLNQTTCRTDEILPISYPRILSKTR